MGVRTWIEQWPAYRQATGTDRLPYHWGWAGYSTGDSANDLIEISLDPNVHIQETKAFACDIRPGRRPTGAARPALVREYQERAGITEQTGTEP